MEENFTDDSFEEFKEEVEEFLKNMMYRQE